MNSINKVIFNTSILYGQLARQLVLGLLTTRIIFEALGEIDYGIYMLVAGVVALLGVLNSSMINTSMRYMAHSLGGGDIKRINVTFNTTLFIHIIVGLLVIVLLEIGGWVMFEYILNIPIGKMYEAKVVFQCMIATTFISIVSVPYDAVINAHEDIYILSLVDVLGFVLNLLLAVYLLYADSSLLIQYGIFVLVIQFFMRILKQIISKKRYVECRMNLRDCFDKKYAKEILSFTGWNLFGSLASVITIQVRSIILNSFFGVRLNAAEGVSKNASAPINMIASSMTRAINPLLVKSEGGGERNKMLDITVLSTKYSIFLFSIFSIPVIFEAPYLLKLWLHDVPEYAIIFCQLSLVAMLIEKFTFQLTDAFRAVGDIKYFQISETIVRFIYIPIIYLLFIKGATPIMIYILGIGTSILCCFVRLYFAKKILKIHIMEFLIRANIPLIIPILLSSISCFCIYKICEEGFLRLFLLSFVSFIVIASFYFILGMTREEKQYLYILFMNLKRKF